MSETIVQEVKQGDTPLDTLRNFLTSRRTRRKQLAKIPLPDPAVPALCTCCSSYAAHD